MKRFLEETHNKQSYKDAFTHDEFHYKSQSMVDKWSLKFKHKLGQTDDKSNYLLHNSRFRYQPEDVADKMFNDYKGEPAINGAFPARPNETLLRSTYQPLNHKEVLPRDNLTNHWSFYKAKDAPHENPFKDSFTIDTETERNASNDVFTDGVRRNAQLVNFSSSKTPAGFYEGVNKEYQLILARKEQLERENKLLEGDIGEHADLRRTSIKTELSQAETALKEREAILSPAKSISQSVKSGLENVARELAKQFKTPEKQEPEQELSPASDAESFLGFELSQEQERLAGVFGEILEKEMNNEDISGEFDNANVKSDDYKKYAEDMQLLDELPKDEDGLPKFEEVRKGVSSDKEAIEKINFFKKSPYNTRSRSKVKQAETIDTTSSMRRLEEIYGEMPKEKIKYEKKKESDFTKNITKMSKVFSDEEFISDLIKDRDFKPKEAYSKFMNAFEKPTGRAESAKKYERVSFLLSVLEEDDKRPKDKKVFKVRGKGALVEESKKSLERIFGNEAVFNDFVKDYSAIKALESV